MSLLDEIKVLVADGYTIADEHGIIGLKRKVYRNSEPGYKVEDNNFGHMVFQEFQANRYEAWFQAVEKAFVRYGIHRPKFRIEAETFDPSVESNLSAQRFLRRLKLLEKMSLDTAYCAEFMSPYSKPPVHYARKLLSQADKSHKLETNLISLFDLLWKYRSVINSSGNTIRTPEPKTRAFVQQKLNINHDAMVLMAKNINSIRSKKHIYAWLKYPDKATVYLEVSQDTE